MIEPIEKADQIKNQRFAEQFYLTERGVRKEWSNPHNMAFPAMISALKVFLGMESHLIEIDGGFQDYDYYFQMGITTEGFTLFCQVPLRYGGSNLWGDGPLKNSLSAEGIIYHIAGLDETVIHDTLIDFNTVKSSVCEHLSQDKPILISNQDGTFLLVTGYKEYGDVLIAYQFKDGEEHRNKAVEIKANCKEYNGWIKNLQAIIYIDGYDKPEKRKDIIMETLNIAYEMLTATQLQVDMNDHRAGSSGPGRGAFDCYYYGEALYKKWIERIDDDANFQTDNDKDKYIDPEIWDLAERRCYAAQFLNELINSDELLGKTAFVKASNAFAEIHDNMKLINGLISGENDGKLLERKTRDTIIAILKECRELDLVAADNIKKALE